MPELFSPSLADEIACVRREIGMRERVYPRRVADGKMKQAAADREVEIMRAVLDRLLALNQKVNYQAYLDNQARVAERDGAGHLSVDLYPWERSYGSPLQKDRDIETAPYDRQERRVVNYLPTAIVGGGDDPVGFLIASHALAQSEIDARDAALREARVDMNRMLDILFLRERREDGSVSISCPALPGFHLILSLQEKYDALFVALKQYLSIFSRSQATQSACNAAKRGGE